MTAPKLVEFIERKLEEHGATDKVIPPDNVIENEVSNHVETASRAAVQQAFEQRVELDKIAGQLRSLVLEKTKVSRQSIAQILNEERERRWSEPIDESVSRAVGDQAVKKSLDELISLVIKPSRVLRTQRNTCSPLRPGAPVRELTLSHRSCKTRSEI